MSSNKGPRGVGAIRKQRGHKFETYTRYSAVNDEEQKKSLNILLKTLFLVFNVKICSTC